MPDRDWGILPFVPSVVAWTRGSAVAIALPDDRLPFSQLTIRAYRAAQCRYSYGTWAHSDGPGAEK